MNEVGRGSLVTIAFLLLCLAVAVPSQAFVVNGIWTNPDLEEFASPPSGLGTPTISWGDGQSSSLGWETITHSASEPLGVNVPFPIGKLTFFNGTIVLGSGITGCDIFLTTTSVNPDLDGLQTELHMETYTSPNIFSPPNSLFNADDVWFPYGSNFGRKYFHVREDRTATATVMGQLNWFPFPDKNSRDGHYELEIGGFADEVVGDGVVSDMPISAIPEPPSGLLLAAAIAAVASISLLARQVSSGA